MSAGRRYETILNACMLSSKLECSYCVCRMPEVSGVEMIEHVAFMKLGSCFSLYFCIYRGYTG